MKILITGSSGFIGARLYNELSKNYDVFGIDNLNNYYDIILKLDRNKNSAVIDLRDKINLCRFFRDHKFDIVIHLAAQAGVRYSVENPQTYIDNNITGFLNILDCCKDYNIKHLLYASSSSVYENKSMYAVTKKTNELMASVYNHLYNLPVTGMRFFTVYGPYGRPDMAYYKFTKNIFEGKPIDIYNAGDMQRSFTYIDDVVESIKRLIHIAPENKIYDIGNEVSVPLMRFIETIEKYTGIEAIKNFVDMQKGDVIDTYTNCKQLFNDINYKPETPIDEGLKYFVNWYKEYYDI